MESEVKSWLKTLLKIDIEDFSVDITGSSEKGDGYMSDITFVSLHPITGKQSQNYDLVIKSSKRSEALRNSAPMKESFLNEIHIYEKVLPAFDDFLKTKGVIDVFTSVPKCYGNLVSENMEIIILENVRQMGYVLWDKKKPFIRKHIDLVLGEYAKLHAVSIAMQDQQVEMFETLHRNLNNVFEHYMNKTDIVSYFGSTIEEIYELFQGDLDEETLAQWRKLKDKVDFTFRSLVSEVDDLKVITHGDCWCNNFMFKNEGNNEMLPSTVAILDWQESRYTSPILDLSHFIFNNISEEDIAQLDDILEDYYQSLNTFVERLGSKLNLLYPREEFFNNWRKYCKYGIISASFMLKICATEKEEVVDLTESAEKGESFSKSFDYDVKNKTCLKNRCRHIVKYVVEKGLI